MRYLRECDGILRFKRRQEIMEICAWGDGLRIRATENICFTDKNWALEIPAQKKAKIVFHDKTAEISNGSIKAVVTEYGKIRFYNEKGKLLLKEFYRSWDYGIENWEDLDECVMLRETGRNYHNVGGDNYKIQVKFESDDEERIYGMGQYQHPYLNLKGCNLQLIPKNTQVSIPFCISNKGYGMLWNNPAIGSVSFGKNITEYTAESTKQLDYWITAGHTPAEILEKYAAVTGRVPMMPDYAMGFWQCKLRYMTQDEVLNVAREYHRRKIPLKVMVIDFFHWPFQGDWKFDKEYWPDPKAMAKELHQMGIKLMVSVWPTVEEQSENSMEMREHDFLVRSNRGGNFAIHNTRVYDATNPEAQKYVWEKCRKNYYDLGVDMFWLDEAEPEFTSPDFDNYRYYAGSALECGNIYSMEYAKGFYTGMKEAGEENPVSLIRCGWAGCQKYGALVWSGDVPSSFTYLKYQVRAGLNMGLAGIPWWTADIGGFHGGYANTPEFCELLMRWFQFGTFCPVMRLHGDREPHKKPIGTTGGGVVASGADNEVWSYGREAENMMIRYIRIRENLQFYIKAAMQEAHEKGTPVIKPLFYDFPDDRQAWFEEDSYLFGHSLLVSPVTEAGIREKKVYLPKGACWTEVYSGKVYEGGEKVTVQAPLEVIPLFVKKDELELKLFE